MSNQRIQFRKNVENAIADTALQSALDKNAHRRKEGRQKAFASLGQDLEMLRSQAQLVRQEVIRNLDNYLSQFADNCRTNGITVHFARNSETAQQIVLQIAKTNGARLIAKSKSMVSEEIHLNQALEEQGIQVVETDLGEFIVQLRSERPSHILTPAVHLNRQQVAATFHEHFAMPLTDDIRVMNDEARSQLRDVFLKADIGISGVNFGVAETGTLCLVTNEGNGRMVTTVPHIHIALMGVERLVPTLSDLSLMLKLLPRSATGQKITSYVSLIQTARQPADQDGPQERHLILVDNQRKSLLNTPFEEALNCIRCGACLNACPVFQEIGGHAYGSVYPGPIGSLVSPALFGVHEFGHLSKASSLCGACMDACPVKIDFPSLLLRMRYEYIREVRQPIWMRMGMEIYAKFFVKNKNFVLAQKLLQLVSVFLPKSSGWFRHLPPPLNRWTNARDFPAIPSQTFRQNWMAKRENFKKPVQQKTVKNNTNNDYTKYPTQLPNISSQPDLVGQLQAALLEIDAEVQICDQAKLPVLLQENLIGSGVRTVLLDDDLIKNRFPDIETSLKEAGITVLASRLMLKNHARKEGIQWLSQANAGITSGIAAFADTGTIMQISGSDRSQLASLLPPVHFIVLQAEDIYASMDDWLQASGEKITTHQSISLISGPSRTADIEMTLTIGVHGPGRLLVFIVSP
jgi:L-lactate dehydrogenase complex protein LldF